MKIKYFGIIIIIFLISCNKTITEEEENIYEFTSEKPYFQFVDDFNNINDFEKYFRIENNVIINKSSKKPFTGEITINSYYDLPKFPKLTCKHKLYFINGYLYQLESTNYRSYDTDPAYANIILSISRNKVFTFINENKQMEYYFSTLESHGYFDRWFSDDTYKLELTRSLKGSGFPGGLLKITEYNRGEIESEGYGQEVTIPDYYDKDSLAHEKGYIGWTSKIGKVGIWKYYAGEGLKWDHNGENTYEKMWVLENKQMDNIENYEFEQ